jgi:hypothetical protein
MKADCQIGVERVSQESLPSSDSIDAARATEVVTWRVTPIQKGTDGQDAHPI